jgi:hypothetical protein
MPPLAAARPPPKSPVPASSANNKPPEPTHSSEPAAIPSRSSAAPRVFESEAAIKESPGFFTGLKQLVFGGYQSTPDTLGSHPDVSMELAAVAASAITAWESMSVERKPSRAAAAVAAAAHAQQHRQQ